MVAEPPSSPGAGDDRIKKDDARGRKRGKIKGQLLQPAVLYRKGCRLCELINAVSGEKIVIPGPLGTVIRVFSS